MPGAELSALKAWWTDGYLVIGDTAGNAIITVNPSSGGVKFANAGGVTISTGILGGLTISTGILGGLTVSSGQTINGNITVSSGYISYTGQKTASVTTNKTLTVSSAGELQLITVSDAIITLPGAGSSGKILNYKIISTITTAGQAVIKTTTTEIIVGGGVASTAGVSMLSNTAATHVAGDYVWLVNNAVSTSWSILEMAGTWASTT